MRAPTLLALLALEWGALPGCIAHKSRQAASPAAAVTPTPGASPAASPSVTPPAPTKAEVDAGAAAMPLAALTFPKPAKDAEGRDLIRVKIFPHFSGKPDDAIDKVTIVGDCGVFNGKRRRAAPDGTEQRTVQRLEISVKTFKHPLWLRCAEATIERASGTPRRYAGSFYVRMRKNSDSHQKRYIEVTNIVPIETYLRGVVPTEIVPGWPTESLRAQAVAARTYAYYNIAHNKTSRDAEVFDVDDTPIFQAYSGLNGVHPATDKAIEDTAGVVMNVNGKVILTFFHADSGGFTESAAEVFGLNAPYCVAKREPDGIGAPATWKETTSYQELAAKLGLAIVPAGKKITAVRIDPKDRTASGRVRAVTLTLDGGMIAIAESVPFKRAAGGLQSSLYDVVDAGGGVVKIDGKGSGHGVGLSQRSAKDLAQKGWDFRKILAFYYDGATPCALAGAKSGINGCAGAH